MNVENVEDVILASELLPMLEELGKVKNLNVYVFDNEEIKKYFTPKDESLGIALLAKDEDNALHNIKNLRKCYLIRFE
jgi:hypothetical protein